MFTIIILLINCSSVKVGLSPYDVYHDSNASLTRLERNLGLRVHRAVWRQLETTYGGCSGAHNVSNRLGRYVQNEVRTLEQMWLTITVGPSPEKPNLSSCK